MTRSSDAPALKEWEDKQIKVIGLNKKKQHLVGNVMRIFENLLFVNIMDILQNLVR